MYRICAISQNINERAKWCVYAGAGSAGVRCTDNLCVHNTMFVQHRLHRAGRGRFEGPVHDMPVGYVQADERERGVHELRGKLELVGWEHHRHVLLL